MSQHRAINMWSGPRNVSTAIMYSFAQRDDTKVLDEPFYAHYLIQSGVEHPGRTKVLESQPKDAEVVMQNLQSIRQKNDVIFLKNMAHHMIEMGDTLSTLINKFRHIFLIRDPKEMLPSLNKALPNPSLRDTAYKRQLELFKRVKSKGFSPNVIDAGELLKDPREVLTTLCNRLNIPFTDKMLSWKEGPIPEDGIWAEYWYDNVHQSTGFEPYTPKNYTLPEHLKPLYERCKPIYKQLFAHAIKINQ